MTGWSIDEPAISCHNMIVFSAAAPSPENAVSESGRRLVQAPQIPAMFRMNFFFFMEGVRDS